MTRLLGAWVFAVASAGTAGQDAMSEAHAMYKRGDYAGAASKYEQALAQDTTNGPAHFFLAHSYDQLYAPSRRG